LTESILKQNDNDSFIQKAITAQEAQNS